MARALADIMTELNSVYNPQRDRSQQFYNQGIEALAPQEQADMGGLEVAKTNAFESINTGANRRGMFFSGIPLAEQAKFVGENYLPSIAGLKNRYAGIRGNLKQTLYQQLADLDMQQDRYGREIEGREIAQDQENQRLALMREEADRAARAASAGSSSGGGASFGRTTAPTTAKQQLTLRQGYQQEANAGDAEAQVMLNYVDDLGRYDGPVKSLEEYRILKANGAVGSYYYQRPLVTSGAGLKVVGGGGGGLSVQGGGTVPKIGTSTGTLRL